MNYLVVWLIGIVVFATLEAATYQLVCVWFAVGSIGAFLAAYVGLGLNIQIAMFVAVSVVALLLLRPISMKFVKRKGITKTNVNALEGKEVLITKNVVNRTSDGEGKINGLTWSVRSTDDNVTIEAGETAEIVRVEGVKLIVKKKD